MKTKKLNKRLTLSKQTIAGLNSKDLNSARGGNFTQYCTGGCNTNGECGKETYDTFVCCTQP